MADKGSIQKGLLEHIVNTVLSRMSIDASGRLRVSSEATVIYSGTVTTCTNVTNMGGVTAASRGQVESQLIYSTSYRANLVIT